MPTDGALVSLDFKAISLLRWGIFYPTRRGARSLMAGASDSSRRLLLSAPDLIIVTVDRVEGVYSRLREIRRAEDEHRQSPEVQGEDILSLF